MLIIFYSGILLFKHSDKASIALIFFSALEELSTTVARTFPFKREYKSVLYHHKSSQKICCSY
jgi:hypothetical protein